MAHQAANWATCARWKKKKTLEEAKSHLFPGQARRSCPKRPVNGQSFTNSLSGGFALVLKKILNNN